MHSTLSRKPYIPVSNNYLDIYSVTENLCQFSATKNPWLEILVQYALPYTNIISNCPRPFPPVSFFFNLIFGINKFNFLGYLLYTKFPSKW